MLICNATALLGGSFVRGASLRVENGVIAEIGELVPRDAEQIIDARGLLLSPGFVDVHTHGYGGQDTMNGRIGVEHMAKGIVKHGITGFLPTTMAAPYEDTRNALQAVRDLMDSPPQGARILGCHLEGPFLNVAKKGAQPAQYIFPPSMDNYKKITSGLESAVKLMTIAPEVEGAMTLIAQLKDRIELSAGHTDASVDQMSVAADAGITQVTHLFNGMNALSHRAPGVPGAALSDDRIRVQMIADLLHLHRAALKLSWRAKGRERCLLITDAMEATGMPDGEYRLGANHVTVRNREARLSDGTLAGSTLTMERAVRNMVREVGVPAEQALYMASTAPADSIGETRRGRIEAGAHADLVLLDDDYQVLMTMVAGIVMYQR